MAGLAGLTAELKVAGSILAIGSGPILRVLKLLRNEGTVFALPMARLSRDLDEPLANEPQLCGET